MDLGTCNWTLTAVWPYAPLLQNSLETGAPLQGIFDPIAATVPGCVQNDLLQAGLIAHPYQRMNSLDCEWVENRWWVYETQFDTPIFPGKRYFIDCAGIDHECLIYLNDKLITEGKGMFLSLCPEVTKYLQPKGNRLRIVLLDAPKELALGHTSHVTTQKSRFCYKWDFSTRMVHLGIWDSITLRETGSARITQTCITTDFDGKHGLIHTRAKTDVPCEIEFALYDGNMLMDKRRTKTGRHTFRFARPKLWQAGTGQEQPLYRVEILAVSGGTVSDSQTHMAGVRSLRFEQTENAPEGAPPYTILLNGTACYIKGVNIVPLDQMYGCVDEARYEHFCRSLVRANVNLVRIWGGGLVEKEAFYDWCDRLGILIWQEFIQSSSGVENVPPTTKSYLKLLRKNARAMVLQKRNHTATCIYCGGNELREMAGVDTPATIQNKNLALLQNVVHQLDPDRLFLPTSAFGPTEYLTAPGAHYDVHGTWKYEGTTDHYTLYNESDALLHSEFGSDGMSRAQTIRWILDDPGAKPVPMEACAVRRFHGEWWDTFARDEALFGATDDLEIAVRRSQLVQAEAVRYPVEANRRRSFSCAGSIVWQFNEPWPNISATSLTEYDGTPKLAYHFLRNAYARQAVTLWYQTLCPQAGSVVLLRAVFVGDSPMTKEQSIVLCIRDYSGTVLLRQTVQSGNLLRVRTPETPDSLYFVTLTLEQDNQLLHENTYFFSTDPGAHPLRALLRSGGTLQCDTEDGRTIIRNTGNSVSLYITQQDCGVFTLFPGETRSFEGIHTGFVPINP